MRTLPVDVHEYTLPHCLINQKGTVRDNFLNLCKFDLICKSHLEITKKQEWNQNAQKFMGITNSLWAYSEYYICFPNKSRGCTGYSFFPQVLFRICIFFLTNEALMIKTQLTQAFKEPVKFGRQVDGRKGSCHVSKEQVTYYATRNKGEDVSE